MPSKRKAKRVARSTRTPKAATIARAATKHDDDLASGFLESEVTGVRLSTLSPIDTPSPEIPEGATNVRVNVDGARSAVVR